MTQYKNTSGWPEGNGNHFMQFLVQEFAAQASHLWATELFLELKMLLKFQTLSLPTNIFFVSQLYCVLPKDLQQPYRGHVRARHCLILYVIVFNYHENPTLHTFSYSQFAEKASVPQRFYVSAPGPMYSKQQSQGLHPYFKYQVQGPFNSITIGY